MHTLLIVLQILLAVILIVVIMLQPSKTDGFNLISGGGNDTFYSKNKSRTHEATLKRITVFSAVAFAIVTVALNLLK